MTAYNEIYLNDAMQNLGEAFDYAVNVCGLDPDRFYDLFVSSGIADQFGIGNPKYVSGLSGTELVLNILPGFETNTSFADAQIEYDYSREYWAGWILAYYQWYKCVSFQRIHENISMGDILNLYPALHEASEDKFVDTLDAVIIHKAHAEHEYIK